MPQVLPHLFWLLLGMVLLVRVVPPAGYVVLLGIAVYALRGAKESVQALTLLAFCIIVNKKVMPVDISAFRWLVLFAAFGRVIWDTVLQEARMPAFIWPLSLFFVTTLLTSLLVSPLPLVSVLKLVTFTLGLSAIFISFYRTADLKAYWASWFLTMALFILIASVPVYFMPEGFDRNSVGFQGLTNHPQTFGPIIAPFAAYMTGRVLFLGDRSIPLMVGMCLAWSAIYLSQSRTAMLAAALGFVVMFGVGFLKSKTWWPIIGRSLGQMHSVFVILLLIGFMALRWSTIQESAISFLLKDDAADGEMIVSSIAASREGLANRSMENFYRSPITGIGFGVPSDPTAAQIVTGFLGLPISATVEKGFMPTAVLEETGITGAVLTIILILSLLYPISARSSIPLFWMVSTCLLINAGEMVFFALGGNGLFIWLLMGWAYTSAQTAPAGHPPLVSIPRPRSLPVG